MSPVKLRISNVLAWAGFGAMLFAVILFFGALIPGIFFQAWISEDKVLEILTIVLLFWLLIAVANYILSGNFRLLPWKNIPAAKKE